MSFVLGIDFGGTKIAFATATPSGETLREARIETRASDGAKEVLRRGMDMANALVKATPGRLVAAGVATFGALRAGRVRLAPNVPGWEGLPLPAILRDGLGVAGLYVDNDVNAAAVAELHWGGLRGADVGLYVNLGTGIGAALVVGGQVVPGTHGTAVANLTTVRDPERVVVGGGMATAFLPALRAAIDGAAPFPPPVEAARFTDDASLVGAVALAVRTASAGDHA